MPTLTSLHYSQVSNKRFKREFRNDPRIIYVGPNLYRYTVFSGVFQFVIPVVLISVVYVRILLFIKVAGMTLTSKELL